MMNKTLLIVCKSRPYGCTCRGRKIFRGGIFFSGLIRLKPRPYLDLNLIKLSEPGVDA